MNPNPIDQFATWYDEHLTITPLKLPSACCLSTNGLDGFPNARFVALKEFGERGFIVTGPLNSRKGIEITRSNKVALTFWWEETERQVRIQGEAFQIEPKEADAYFSERSYESQIVSAVSAQGNVLENLNLLNLTYENLLSKGETITRPESWGGYLIKPIRIEFMQFKSTRFHDRILYKRKGNIWETSRLQP